MALWLSDNRQRDRVVRVLREQIGVDDLTARQTYTSPTVRAEHYIDIVLKTLDYDSLIDEDDDLEPKTHGLYVTDSGIVWSLDGDGWISLGYVDEKIDEKLAESEFTDDRVEWTDIGHEALTITPLLRPPSNKIATVYRGTSKSVHFIDKPFVWRVHCSTCAKNLVYRPTVKYRTAERRAVHHNQSVHGVDYWSE